MALGKVYLYMAGGKAYIHGSWLGLPVYAW